MDSNDVVAGTPASPAGFGRSGGDFSRNCHQTGERLWLGVAGDRSFKSCVGGEAQRFNTTSESCYNLIIFLAILPIAAVTNFHIFIAKSH